MATLNTCQEPVIQGMHERRGINMDDDGINKTTPLKVAPHRDTFSDLLEEEIVKIFKNKFKLMNLYKLRHFYGFEDTQEKDNIIIMNSSL